MSQSSHGSDDVTLGEEDQEALIGTLSGLVITHSANTLANYPLTTKLLSQQSQVPVTVVTCHMVETTLINSPIKRTDQNYTSTVCM